MQFHHHHELWSTYPDLVPGVLHVSGITATAAMGKFSARYDAIARERLTEATESDLPEIQAWRRTFSAMGLKPTQYRCAAESLLRRFRKEGELPHIHPLIDLCNAISLAFAVPIAVFDLDQIEGNMEVRFATGDEQYVTFGGEIEHPEAGEVAFVDEAGFAHARRWTNRQSGKSAIRPETTSALIVSEALHATAAQDMVRLVAALEESLGAVWNVKVAPRILTPVAPVYDTTHQPVGTSEAAT